MTDTVLLRTPDVRITAFSSPGVIDRLVGDYGFNPERSSSVHEDSTDILTAITSFWSSTTSRADLVSNRDIEQLKRAELANKISVKDVTGNIAQIQKLTGLSLEAIADLLDTNRRSIFNWVNGKPTRDKNQKKIASTLDVIRYFDRGTAEANNAILYDQRSGETIADLIKRGLYGTAKDEAGIGSGRSADVLAHVHGSAVQAYGPMSIEDELSGLVTHDNPADATRKAPKSRSRKVVRG